MKSGPLSVEKLCSYTHKRQPLAEAVPHYRKRIHVCDHLYRTPSIPAPPAAGKVYQKLKKFAPQSEEVIEARGAD
ncbi:MAG TPA: hypothetical protein EYG40_02550 [Verrucomicrobia bacterium]|nr:hypothetical protein [Verrucomicrobiales bacterium]HIL53899.1 hypothetical protein [Verrucomicrobiota bacterium]